MTWDATEGIIVDQGGDRWMGPADPAVGVLMQLDELEAHIPSVIKQQPAGHWLTNTQDELERFSRLQHADGARQDTKHTTFLSGRNQTMRGWVGEQAAVTRSNTSIEHTDLTLVAVNRAIHIGFTRQNAKVIGQVAGWEVVGTIDDQPVWLGNRHGIGRGGGLGIDIHLDIRGPGAEAAPW